jgi:hypothetical protein
VIAARLRRLDEKTIDVSGGAAGKERREDSFWAPLKLVRRDGLVSN